MTETKTITFFGTCTALDEATLVSGRIFVPWKLKRIVCTFATGCMDRVKLRFFYSPDGSTSPTGQPPGVSLLQDLT